MADELIEKHIEALCNRLRLTQDPEKRRVIKAQIFVLGYTTKFNTVTRKSEIFKADMKEIEERMFAQGYATGDKVAKQADFALDGLLFDKIRSVLETRAKKVEEFLRKCFMKFGGVVADYHLINTQLYGRADSDRITVTYKGSRVATLDVCRQSSDADAFIYTFKEEWYA